MKTYKTVLERVENGWILTQNNREWDGSDEQTILFPLINGKPEYKIFQEMLNVAFGEKYEISVKPIFPPNASNQKLASASNS